MRRSRNFYPWVSLFPALLVILLFTIYPVLHNLDLALHKNILTQPDRHPFVGSKNFVEVIQSPYFLSCMGRTLLFTAVCVAGVAVLSIAIALLLNERFAGASILQVLILIPWAIPVVMAGIIWRWIFAGNVGVLNGILYSLGLIDNYISFFGSPVSAFSALVIARLWKDLPLAVILLLASLQVIPRELYDAAKVDGAGPWKCFLSITLPYLRSTLTVILILETLIGLITFDLIYVMTGGGPADSTTLVAWYAYTEIFTNLNLGRGAALAFVVALITLIVSVFYFRALRSEKIY
ncbi:MAG: sugar ABC transporter permease [Planctomycetota bacterium]|jgi:ABC-type sugar transport system permease subunit|nr:sugar ABC transporter permease [Planctomycetota bacterium]